MRPNRATLIMMLFFPMTSLLGPSGVPQAVTISIITGNTNANADEQRAPSNEMNAFNTGTTSANESAKLKKEYNQFFVQIILASQMRLWSFKKKKKKNYLKETTSLLLCWCFHLNDKKCTLKLMNHNLFTSCY